VLLLLLAVKCRNLKGANSKKLWVQPIATTTFVEGLILKKAALAHYLPRQLAREVVYLHKPDHNTA
jgi:hypothetical protein